MQTIMINLATMNSCFLLGRTLHTKAYRKAAICTKIAGDLLKEECSLSHPDVTFHTNTPLRTNKNLRAAGNEADEDRK